MIELIYASAATTPFTPTELAELLEHARVRNTAVGLTGLLLYHEGSFLQVLEGDAAAVDATVERIQADPRHRHIQLMLRRTILERSFGQWRMGFLSLATASRAALDGFSDFLRGGSAGLNGNSESIARVICAFREGKYHRAIR